MTATKTGVIINKVTGDMAIRVKGRTVKWPIKFGKVGDCVSVFYNSSGMVVNITPLNVEEENEVDDEPPQGGVHDKVDQLISTSYTWR